MRIEGFSRPKGDRLADFRRSNYGGTRIGFRRLIRYPAPVTSIRLSAMRSTPHFFVRGGGLVARMLPENERLHFASPPGDVEPGSVRVTENILSRRQSSTVW
jgi:hypothetical protein